MMRELKFRGIYPHSGQWFYGHYVNYFPETPRIVSDGFSTPVKIETVGQFTGYFDKKSIEIFEGDLIESFNKVYDNSKSINEVVFEKGCWKLRSNGKNDIPLFNYKTGEIEVIGNIYKTPELI
jgi:YopX protein